MPIGKKIRIYDLARELKQDAKRVMEDLRREGADVSVPSNSVSGELADKIRTKYFPKADAAPQRGIKVIKAAKKEESPATEETPSGEHGQGASAEAKPAPRILRPTGTQIKQLTLTRDALEKGV